jgi:cell wall assembly regulator SMI1
MTDAVLLTTQLLGEYEARLRRLGVPVDEAAPGLDAHAQDRITASVDLTLPDEARVWWGWHDGSPGWAHGTYLGYCGEELVSLQTATEIARSLRDLASEFIDGGEVDASHAPWSPAWLPLARTRYAVALDCGVASNEASPIRNVSFEDFASAREIVVPSLGTLVSWWCEAIDEDAWTWDHERKRWLMDRQRMNPGLLRVGGW